MIQEISEGETRRRGDDTREALVVAATELFGRKGYDGVSVEEIARHARANKATISYHFGGKAALYQAILKRMIGESVQRVTAAAEEAESAELALRDVIRAFADVTMRHPRFPAMMLREVMSGAPHIDAELLPEFARMMGVVAGVVDRGVRAGQFRSVDPRYTHLSILGSLMFFFAAEPFRARLMDAGIVPSQPGFDAGDYVTHIQELTARGLLVSSPAQEEA